MTCRDWAEIQLRAWVIGNSAQVSPCSASCTMLRRLTLLPWSSRSWVWYLVRLFLSYCACARLTLSVNPDLDLQRNQDRLGRDLKTVTISVYAFGSIWLADSVTTSLNWIFG